MKKIVEDSFADVYEITKGIGKFDVEDIGLFGPLFEKAIMKDQKVFRPFGL
jgi:hypothetical protein